MVESESFLTDYFSDLRVEEKDMNEIKSQLLLFLLKRMASYPTEISRELDIDIKLTNKAIFDLLKSDLIQRLEPHPYEISPSSILWPQIHKLNARGTTGYDSFCRFSWWTISPIGFEYLKAKHRGLTIDSRLAEHLGAKEDE